MAGKKAQENSNNESGASKVLKSLDNFLFVLSADIDGYTAGKGNLQLLKDDAEFELILKLLDKSDKIRKLIADSEVSDAPDATPKNIQDFALKKM
jgi:hypothetical protein